MPFAALAKIDSCLEKIQSQLPVGVLFSQSVFYKEIIRIFKTSSVYREDMPFELSAPRAMREAHLQKQPIQCLISDKIDDSQQVGQFSKFILSPMLLYLNQVPPHGIKLNKEIKQLRKDSVVFNHIFSLIFTSAKLYEIYNTSQTKSTFMKLPVRPFWDGVRNPSNKAITSCEIPIESGKYDIHKLINLQNSMNVSILQQVCGDGLAWHYNVRNIFLTAKCFINLSYCNPDIYIFMMAACCGCPVVSVPNIFIEEIFKNSAFIVEDEREISRLDKNKLKTISKEQRNFIHENYIQQYDNIKKEWENLFKLASDSEIC